MEKKKKNENEMNKMEEKKKPNKLRKENHSK